MSLQRVRLHGDHAGLNIAGRNFVPDDTGAFLIPTEVASELIRVHGGAFEPGAEVMEGRLAEAKAALAAAKTQVDILERAVRAATENLAKFKTTQEAQATKRLDAATTPAAIPVTDTKIHLKSK
jgi:hypothetical protein